MSTPEHEQAGGAQRPSEDEMRAYEAELARITTTDVIMQVSVSLLNLGARRLAPSAGEGEASGRDLEQVRDAIDGVRALLEILERRAPQEIAPLRDALSQLQIAYARAVGAEPAGGAEGRAGEHSQPQAARSGAAPAEGAPAAGQEQDPGQGPGPAESSGRLWVPGR